METSQPFIVPFDKVIFATRLKAKRISCNDLINHPCIEFSKTQLLYFKKTGMIPKRYLDQIDNALDNINFKDCKRYHGRKYSGELIDFGTSEYNGILERCKKLDISFTNVLNLEHVSPQTVNKYKKERHIPSDLLEQINRRLKSMETEVVEKPVEEIKVETPIKKIEYTKISVDDHIGKRVIQNLKNVVRCNGEANLNLDNISTRYNCDIETFVNSVFSLVSCENYVIFTTYNNGKPVFTLGEPM